MQHCIVQKFAICDKEKKYMENCALTKKFENLWQWYLGSANYLSMESFSFYN
jgi:hypothetical protein